ncbi:hypothetical protein [Nonomuraea soli]|uniref:SPOR domain-containing protein n=1 Tax=Nonomuraea soli TaxID=1032476 RepID=A0A7W0CDX7_9ACTN|nr:hypothetical protein [Nonomuraea soli]MBA2889354.1 hypothetical protein [Nonomuraea soli]
MSTSQWWFCLKHQRVEPEQGCPNKDRMGPYASEQEAAGALQRAKERNEAYDGRDDEE